MLLCCMLWKLVGWSSGLAARMLWGHARSRSNWGGSCDYSNNPRLRADAGGKTQLSVMASAAGAQQLLSRAASPAQICWPCDTAQACMMMWLTSGALLYMWQQQTGSGFASLWGFGFRMIEAWSGFFPHHSFGQVS